MRTRQFAPWIAALLILTGCSESADGTAIADAPPAADQFDPCSIPDDAIAAAGLDPRSKTSLSAEGYATPGWTTCRWAGPGEGSWYTFSAMFSPLATLDDIRSKAANVDVSDTVVEGRVGLSYRLKATDQAGVCNLAFESGGGVATFLALSRTTRDSTNGDLCTIVRTHTEQLALEFPPS